LAANEERLRKRGTGLRKIALLCPAIKNDSGAIPYEAHRDVSQLPIRVVERNDALNIASRIENLNLA
jgi:hypothetical protein